MGLLDLEAKIEFVIETFDFNLGFLKEDLSSLRTSIGPLLLRFLNSET
jgi:hypothetical protein